MKREIQKRKKGFWALCLAILLAWMQLAPQVVYAAEYTLVYDMYNDSIDYSGIANLYSGDILNCNQNYTYYGYSKIEYYDKDGTTLLDTQANDTSVDGAISLTVEDYPCGAVESQISSGGFKCWKIDDITHGSGDVKVIKLIAEAYTESNIIYMIDGTAYTSEINPSTYFEGKQAVPLQAESKEGYTFDGWYSDVACTTKVTSIAATETGNITLYAKFTGNTYDITYDLGVGETIDGSNPATYVCGVGVSSFSPAVKAGHDFQYWCVEKGDVLEQISSIPADHYGNVTLKPSFTPITYNINYVLDSGTNGVGNPGTYTCGTGVSGFADATKTGYTFGGWFTDASFTTAVTSISTSQTGDVTLYAKFTKNPILPEGTGSITVPNTNYGETVRPVCVSETNGTENVSVTYKMKGADDATYTETVPVKPGDYTARAVFAKTNAYKQVTATCDFSIAYLSAPTNPYTISGTQGKNNYYTTNVTITPADGYLIADSLDGTYQKKLEITKSTDAFSVYLKKTDTGAKTAGIKISKIKIDKSAPVISGAKDGETIYGENVKIVVKDANLSRVKINGKKVTIADKKLDMLLLSNRGEEKYVITGVDLAGNKKTIRITVAAEWTKKKEIPSGEKVKLYKNRSYKFGSKSFKVSNDDTTYAGNTTFYVGSDGDYVFSETN